METSAHSPMSLESHTVDFEGTLWYLEWKPVGSCRLSWLPCLFLPLLVHLLHALPGSLRTFPTSPLCVEVLRKPPPGLSLAPWVPSSQMLSKTEVVLILAEREAEIQSRRWEIWGRRLRAAGAACIRPAQDHASQSSSMEGRALNSWCLLGEGESCVFTGVKWVQWMFPDFLCSAQIGSVKHQKETGQHPRTLAGRREG